MSYYMGDFYRGDPGFFSFLGRGIKGLVGGLLGGGTTKVALSLPAAAGVASSGLSTMQRAGKLARAGAGIVRGTVMKHPVLSAAGAAGAIGLGAGALGGRRMGGGRMMAGGHHRRMRVTNVRALRRSLRRVKGFERIARQVLSITTHHKAHVKGFKFPKRKKRV